MNLKDLVQQQHHESRLSPRWSSTGAMDRHLARKAGDEPQARSVIALTDAYKHAHMIPLPAPAGQRVTIAHNLGMVLTYPNLPAKGVLGTVVTVRTAEGDTTTHNGNVFVKWDDGGFFPVLASHLKVVPGQKLANNYRKVASGLGDLSGFMRVAGKSSDLVHKATKDLWSFRQEGEQFVLERLFDDTGEPLKV